MKNPNLIISDLISYSVSIENADINIMYYSNKNDFKSAKAQRLFHTHACTDIIACCVVSFKVSVDSDVITLNAGDFVIIPDRRSHIKDEALNVPWISIHISCRKNERASSFDFYSFLKPIFNDGNAWLIKNAGKMCRKLFLMTELCEKTINTDNYFDIISFFADIIKSKKELLKAFPANKYIDFNDILIVENLNLLTSSGKKNKISLTDAARLLYVSERQLTRYCYKYFGKSFSKMSNDAAMRSAAYYLVYSDKRIEDIADMLNMSTTFTSRFTKFYSLPPAKYRKQLRERSLHDPTG